MPVAQAGGNRSEEEGRERAWGLDGEGDCEMISECCEQTSREESGEDEEREGEDARVTEEKGESCGCWWSRSEDLF